VLSNRIVPSSRRARARCTAAAAALVVIAPARARAADPPAAQALFNEAKRDANEGRWAAACPKLEESQRLDPGIGTEFHLARCYEHVGRTASAWAAYLDAAASAHLQGQLAREKVARDHAAALEPSLSRLLIAVRSSAPSLRVQRDGVDVGRGQWGTAVPLDPGEHRVSAAAPGRRAWERSFRVEGDAKTVTIDVPELAFEQPEGAPPAIARPAPPSRGAVPAIGPDPSLDVAARDANQGEHRGRGQRIAGVVLGTLGAAGLGIGAYYGLASKSKHDDATAHCDPTGHRCDATGAAERHDAVVFGTASTIGFAAGGAAVLGGIILWATAPSDRAVAASKAGHGGGVSGNARPPRARLDVTTVFGAPGLALRGTW